MWFISNYIIIARYEILKNIENRLLTTVVETQTTVDKGHKALNATCDSAKFKSSEYRVHCDRDCDEQRARIVE